MHLVNKIFSHIGRVSDFQKRNEKSFYFQMVFVKFRKKYHNWFLFDFLFSLFGWFPVIVIDGVTRDSEHVENTNMDRLYL